MAVTFGVFGEKVVVDYTPPQDTRDPRYAACVAHHVACDCREADWAERQHEQRLERQHLRAVVERVLAGHDTYDLNATNPYTGEVAKPCQCTGCQLVREAGL